MSDGVRARIVGSLPTPDDDREVLLNWCDPLNWSEFLSADDDGASEWVLEPIIPAGGQVAIWAKGGMGKSLLLLDCSAALATGRSVLGAEPVAPIDVIYIDMENPATDVRSRMFDFGYTADSDLKRLHYFHMAALPSLDTELGGDVLAAQVERFGAKLVVVDTTASSVTGRENDADTYRDFYRHTGRRLRSTGTALARLDHGGKNRTKGQRGSSAKDDDVDVVWELTASGSGEVLSLGRGKHRIPWVPPVVVFRRQEQPTLRHLLMPTALPPGVGEVAALLDEAGVPLEATVRHALQTLRAAGQGRRQDVVAAALKHRCRPR
jgi:hypothetical protein